MKRWLWRELPAEIDDCLENWLRQGRLTGGQAIKVGRVHRMGGAVVKLYDRGRKPWDFLRVPRALREARLSQKIHPLRAPEPWGVAEGFGRSLLVSQAIDGLALHEVWHSDCRAREELPLFLARMYRQGVVHGDLHPQNILWDGDEWVLIDLDSLRRGLHLLRSKTLANRQWSRLAHNMAHWDPTTGEEMQRLFRIFTDRIG